MKENHIDKSNDLFGHPRGLSVLFFTEMWERMSYYGMRALLVLYMTSYLFLKPDVAQQVIGLETIRSIFGEQGSTWADPLSSKIYGFYTGMVYATSLLGGILADRFLGPRRSIILGSLLMMIGHFLMMSERLFFFALFFLVLGTGAFKPNISAQVGSLYAPSDQRRDGAFTIFYMGINLGALLAPLLCGTLGQKVGWHYGFGSAGIGMAVGLTIYLFGSKYLPNQTAKECVKKIETKELLTRQSILQRTIAIIVIAMITSLFWAAYEQQGNTLQLWADRKTDFHFAGIEIPSSWYQSLNPAFVLMLAPLLDRFWAFQRQKEKEPSTLLKMAIGCFLVSSAYVVMAMAAQVVPEGMRGSILWLTLATWLLTIGELYLSPVGLSLVSRHAPLKMVSILMGVWFFSSFFGNILAGWLGSLTSFLGHTRFFALMLVVCFIPGVIFAFARRPLERMLSSGLEGGDKKD